MIIGRRYYSIAAAGHDITIRSSGFTTLPDVREVALSSTSHYVFASTTFSFITPRRRLGTAGESRARSMTDESSSSSRRPSHYKPIGFRRPIAAAPTFRPGRMHTARRDAAMASRTSFGRAVRPILRIGRDISLLPSLASIAAFQPFYHSRFRAAGASNGRPAPDDAPLFFAVARRGRPRFGDGAMQARIPRHRHAEDALLGMRLFRSVGSTITPHGRSASSAPQNGRMSSRRRAEWRAGFLDSSRGRCRAHVTFRAFGIGRVEDDACAKIAGDGPSISPTRFL